MPLLLLDGEAVETRCLSKRVMLLWFFFRTMVMLVGIVVILPEEISD